MLLNKDQGEPVLGKPIRTLLLIGNKENKNTREGCGDPPMGSKWAVSG